jgi:hypothetical protein
MNGRKYKRKSTDQVCENCGLVFSTKGIKPHERNCDVDEPFLDPTRDASRPTTDESGGGESVDPTDGEADTASQGSPPPSEQAPEAASQDVPAGDIAAGDDADVDASREDDQEKNVVATTDGGNPAFDAPDPVEVERDQDDDRVDDDQDVEKCPHCDEAIDNWGEIDVGELRRCGSCGKVFKKT